MADTIDNTKMPLPNFLKVLTSNGVPPSKAMAVAGKVYKQHNTPASLAGLTESQLKAAGVSEKEDRRVVLGALRKAGYKPTVSPARKSTGAHDTPAGSAGPSTSSSRAAMSGVPSFQPSVPATTSRSKRKRDEGRNEFLPDRPGDELEEQSVSSLEFNEVLDEEVLKGKFVVVNRAPIMMAWAHVVAERLGFQREEALSIASVYTEMNAISKGVSIGLYDEAKKNRVEANKGGSQPYVDLMGRRPLLQTAAESWRALSSGSPVSPASAFSYIIRSLRQTAPFLVGALRLLAQSFPPEELNKRGFYLYADFRPETNEWGGRGEVRCTTILNLRRKGPQPRDGVAVKTEDVVKIEADSGTRPLKGEGDEEGEPDFKKSRGMTLEEYEAALDADDSFANVDLDTLTREPTQKTEPKD